MINYFITQFQTLLRVKEIAVNNEDNQHDPGQTGIYGQLTSKQCFGGPKDIH